MLLCVLMVTDGHTVRKSWAQQLFWMDSLLLFQMCGDTAWHLCLEVLPDYTHMSFLLTQECSGQSPSTVAQRIAARVRPSVYVLQCVCAPVCMRSGMIRNLICSLIATATAGVAHFQTPTLSWRFHFLFFLCLFSLFFLNGVCLFNTLWFSFFAHCALKEECNGIEVPVLILFLMASEIFMFLDLFSFDLRPVKDT